MNRDRIQGKLRQLLGNAREQWGKLTGDPFEVFAGKRDQRAGRIQEQYAITRDEAQRQLAEFKSRNRNWDSV